MARLPSHLDGALVEQLPAAEALVRRGGLGDDLEGQQSGNEVANGSKEDAPAQLHAQNIAHQKATAGSGHGRQPCVAAAEPARHLRQFLAEHGGVAEHVDGGAAGREEFLRTDAQQEQPDTTNITNQTTSTNKMKDQKHISLPSQTLKQLQHSRQQTQHMLRALLGSAYSNSSAIGASPATCPLEHKEKHKAKYAIKRVRYVSDDRLKTDGPF
eukprot:CAMPEP_0177423772 /NCGR_PEP_ID=MMETSP0368-20130122/72079_1 /TAXON_ID=447022 ORGANISM="Scrippsiella hangoei-like, Strain SHHI-4" /NCGR_SAMPLE_ID=MMETSP0368 /ASSEMBLY_ACC=CAM_ASM_000363 /LENGTH=212 /DNA_ID=CAMNT_0018893877 /DNA_START=35 /DNA_END=674 /DNA_ORIENTATION=+